MATTNVGSAEPAHQPNKGRRKPAREYIYLATPKTMYGTDRVRSAVDVLRKRFPGAVLLLPEKLFATRYEWLSRFPEVLETLTRFVFLADPEGYIGRGVASECHAALQAGKPVELMTESGELLPHTRVRLSSPNEKDWARYRRVSVRPAGD